MVRRNRIVTSCLHIARCRTKQPHQKTSMQFWKKQPPETRAYFRPFLQLGLWTSTGQSVLHHKACHTFSRVLWRQTATRGANPAMVHDAISRGIRIIVVRPILTPHLVLGKASCSKFLNGSRLPGVFIGPPGPVDFQSPRR